MQDLAKCGMLRRLQQVLIGRNGASSRREAARQHTGAWTIVLRRHRNEHLLLLLHRMKIAYFLSKDTERFLPALKDTKWRSPSSASPTGTFLISAHIGKSGRQTFVAAAYSPHSPRFFLLELTSARQLKNCSCLLHMPNAIWHLVKLKLTSSCSRGPRRSPPR
jgi:hypothetical protein